MTLAALKSLVRAVLAVLGLLWGLDAHAWGAQGHRVIATLAEKELTPAARKEVKRLLAMEPGQTLVSISTWADEHRSEPSRPWHYVNLPRTSCAYKAQRDCADGRCVVAAIQTQIKVLASSAPDEERLIALKYLVHFAGDVHQPLHAGFQDDKGGNTYQLQAFKHGSNLHALWDTGLIESLGEDTRTMAARLARKGQGKDRGKVKPWTAKEAAQESCRIVAGSGFYPPRVVDDDYIAAYIPVMEDRLALAGARLAELLNRVLK
jgi:hypothetical protein